MLDKDPALKALIKNADLEVDLTKRRPSGTVTVSSDYVKLNLHNVYYQYSDPPEGRYVKGHMLLLHDQTNTSAIWSRIESLQTFAVFGYCCVAPDLPSMGRTGGPAIDEADRFEFIRSFIAALGLKEVIVVGSSMAGRYIVPLLSRCHRKSFPDFRLSCVVAIALSDTNKIVENNSNALFEIMTPCLVLRGSMDTSIGINAVNVLSQLPNSRVVIVPNGRHLCHQSNPEFFHKTVVNFLEVISKNVTKSIFVSEV